MNSKYFSNINLQKKLIIINALLLLLVGTIVFFIIIPSVREIKNMRDDIERERIDLEDKYIKGQSLKKLSDNLNIIEPQLDKLDRVFINQNRELEFITTLESAASANGVAQKINLEVASGADRGIFKKIPLQLFTQGPFLKQMKYLSDLESLNYYINVYSLELSAAQPLAEAAEPDERGNINMFLTADTFWK